LSERPAAAAARARRPPVGSLRLDLRRDTEAPARARAAVERWYPDLAGGRPRQETLLLLVSEIVTNAVMHSPPRAEVPIMLTASIEGENVRVEVTDAGAGFSPPSFQTSRPPQPTTIGGYGLYFVDQGASRWGVDREGGTRVWFEM
jgi:anti-sigma regulatory factor (Ser/Thr protein kinase)